MKAVRERWRAAVWGRLRRRGAKGGRWKGGWAGAEEPALVSLIKALLACAEPEDKEEEEIPSLLNLQLAPQHQPLTSDDRSIFDPFFLDPFFPSVALAPRPLFPVVAQKFTTR